MAPAGVPHQPLDGALDAWTVRASYLDLLGRPALAGEQEQWTGKPSEELWESLLGSEPFWDNWVEEQLFYFLLVDTFRPGEGELGALRAGLVERTLGVRAALHRILLCTSFDRRNPGPDTFVTVVLEQVLGKSAQREAKTLDVGKRMYDGSPGVFLGERGTVQADVVRIAIDSSQALRHFIAREHRRILRKGPETKELSSLVKRLEGDELAFPSIVREWLASPAYSSRLAERLPMPNRVFVRALFVDLMGHPPEPEESRRIRSALDGLSEPAPLRSVLARLLLDSKAVRLPAKEEIADPSGWIRAQFERLLGRLTEEQELSVFVESFGDPACTPATVLHAIVSHPLYATW
jgi:hypothetical protein